MPLKINVGLAKKIGLPDYGSLGANCNIEFEESHDRLNDLDGFHEKVKNVFLACRQAVQDELARQQQAAANGSNGHAAEDADSRPSQARRNGSSNGNGNGHGASEKQMAYLRQLAGLIKGLGVRRLDTAANTMFGKRLVELSSLDASGLIDVLKDVKAGKIGLENVLGGGAA